MVKAVPVKSVSIETNANKKKNNNKVKQGNVKAAKAQASKPIKPKNNVPAKNENNAEKKKKDKKAISEAADENEEVISNDVADLLQRLKKEHGLPENVDQVSTTTNGDVKKEKTNKKNKITAPTKNQGPPKVIQPPGKPTQNKKIVFGDAADDAAVEPNAANGSASSPAKAKAKKNKNKAGQQVKQEPKPVQQIKKEPKPNKKRPLDNDDGSSIAEGSPAKIAKLNDAERTSKRLEKKKNKKKNKAQAAEAAKQTAQSPGAAGNKNKKKDNIKAENANTEGKPKKEVVKKEPSINKQTNQPFKVNPSEFKWF